MRLSALRHLRVVVSGSLFAFCVLSSLTAQSVDMEARRAAYDGPKPKYVMFFIGDGFGMAHSFAAEAYLAAAEGRIGAEQLSLNHLPVFGQISTYAENRLITDSAAAGTALATGCKTTVGTISMDGKREKALYTVAEAARDRGMRVGIVTSVSIDHATPSVFYSHKADRNLYYSIALDLARSGFDYFGGGGFLKPEGDGQIGADNMKQNVGLGGIVQAHDSENCVDFARRMGYTYVNDKQAFFALKSGAEKIIAVTDRLAGGQSITYAIDRAEGELALVDFTRKGIELLAGEEGFFMMVEGGKIDWCSHANDAATTVHEVLDFDRAVQAALAFYLQHPEETLIVVTADHETGGMGIGYAGSHYDGNIYALSHQKMSYEAFSGLVAEYRDAHPDGGSEEEGLALVKENFGLGDSALLLGLNPLEEKELRQAFRDSMSNGEGRDPIAKLEYYLRYGGYDPLTVTATRILAGKAGIGWTTFSHTASPVPVRAIGPGSELFSGAMDNTDMARNIFTLLAE
ncbi:MAG: alkaline phosphatase [Opitutales bacterium]|nr:alkaline phosphatase [Opitutales bacterium]